MPKLQRSTSLPGGQRPKWNSNPKSRPTITFEEISRKLSETYKRINAQYEEKLAEKARLIEPLRSRQEYSKDGISTLSNKISHAKQRVNPPGLHSSGKTARISRAGSAVQLGIFERQQESIIEEMDALTAKIAAEEQEIAELLKQYKLEIVKELEDVTNLYQSSNSPNILYLKRCFNVLYGFLIKYCEQEQSVSLEEIYQLSQIYFSIFKDLIGKRTPSGSQLSIDLQTSSKEIVYNIQNIQELQNFRNSLTCEEPFVKRSDLPKPTAEEKKNLSEWKKIIEPLLEIIDARIAELQPEAAKAPQLLERPPAQLARSNSTAAMTSRKRGGSVSSVSTGTGSQATSTASGPSSASNAYSFKEMTAGRGKLSRSASDAGSRRLSGAGTRGIS